MSKEPIEQPPPPPPGYTAPGYSAGYSAGTTAVVVSQPGPYMPMMFRETPVRCRCPACGADILTSTSFETGTITWVACLIVALIGFWCGCCLIPFCIDGCKDVIHSCPNCRHVVGKYNRM